MNSGTLSLLKYRASGSPGDVEAVSPGTCSLLSIHMPHSRQNHTAPRRYGNENKVK